MSCVTQDDFQLISLVEPHKLTQGSCNDGIDTEQIVDRIFGFVANLLLILVLREEEANALTTSSTF